MKQGPPQVRQSARFAEAEVEKAIFFKMADLMRDIDAMPNSDSNKEVLKRFIGSGSEQVALDKAGRICLPESMAQAAGIKDQAVLVGLLDRFEIWDPERYENVKASDAIMAQEAFKLMA